MEKSEETSTPDIAEDRRVTRLLAKSLGIAERYRLIRLFEDSPKTPVRKPEVPTVLRRISSDSSISFNSKLDSFFNLSSKMADENGEHNIEEAGNGASTSQGAGAAALDQESSNDQSKKLDINDMLVLMSKYNQLVLDCRIEINELKERLASGQQVPAGSNPPTPRLREDPVDGVSPPDTRPRPSHRQQPNQPQPPNPPRGYPFPPPGNLNDSISHFVERNKVFLHKWQIKFDGTGKDMSVDSFIFRVERLAEQHAVSHEKLLAEFHVLLSGNAARWYWQLLEDNKNNPSLEYLDVKRAMLSHFKSSQTDVEIIKELVERKQQPG